MLDSRCHFCLSPARVSVTILEKHKNVDRDVSLCVPHLEFLRSECTGVPAVIVSVTKYCSDQPPEVRQAIEFTNATLGLAAAAS